MAKKIFISITLLILLCGFNANAQGPRSIRINEIMVVNHNNYIDGYGQRIGWIELFNTSYSVVDLGGCYLSVKLGDRDMTYRIPMGDEHTIMEPRGYKIFFCDGTDTKGTFHTNFTLDQTGYIAFLDASSKGIPVDEIKYDVASQQPDVTMGRTYNSEGELVFITLPRTTPMATNEVTAPIPSHELFRQRDPSGVVMAITAMSVVFIALALLYLLFRTVGLFMVRLAEDQSKKRDKAERMSSNSSNSFSGEAEIAAIAMALGAYQSELHDKQSTVLTINRVARAYSPWSSKIYGLRQLPNRK